MPLARAVMHSRQELVHVAQWPTCKEMGLVASRQYAFEGQCFVLAAGSVLERGELLHHVEGNARRLLEEIPGGSDDFVLHGGSAIIAPSGNILAGPLIDEAGILTAELDPVESIEGRLVLDVVGHYSRPDIFRLEVNEKVQAGVEFR